MELLNAVFEFLSHVVDLIGLVGNWPDPM